MTTRHAALAGLAFLLTLGCAQGAGRPTAATDPAVAQGGPRVGPPRGTVVVVGGGAIGPEILTRFIELAGGPDALIIDVPTAGGDSTYPANWRGMNALKAAGARNVVVMHTKDKIVADSDEFAAPLATAGGVWFEGGRQWHLVDSYAGTKTERGFHDVLARGGVVGGSSAGASILSSYMLRGARSGNEIIMAPGYEVGFGFLRGVAIDQHVVARERLRDLADSLMPRRPDLLGISVDEGTAWVIQGDTGAIIGRSKAFVYGGKDPTGNGKPFLTLFPGDQYDLGARRLVSRASDESPVTLGFLDSLFAEAGGMVTVLVARDGKVLADVAYGVPDHPRYMPGTTVPNFPVGDIVAPINALARQVGGADRAATFAQIVTRHMAGPIGWRRTIVDSSGMVQSSVDELYRLSLGLEHDRTFVTDSAAAAGVRVDGMRGWKVDRYRDVVRAGAYGTADGRRNAFVRIPEKRLTIIILSDRNTLDAGLAAERIADRLLQ